MAEIKGGRERGRGTRELVCNAQPKEVSMLSPNKENSSTALLVLLLFLSVPVDVGKTEWRAVGKNILCDIERLLVVLL